MRARTVILAAMCGLLAVGGCKRKRALKTATPRISLGEGDETDGTGDEPGSVAAFDEDDERSKAMEDAYDALVRGDATGVPRTLALGADTLAVVRQAIQSENVNAMVGATRVLAKLPADDAGLALLKTALVHPAPRVRAEALDAVATTKAAGAADEVATLLGDEELEVRATACDTLADLAPKETATLEALFGRLGDKEAVVRASCSAAFAPNATGEAWRTRAANLLLGKDRAAKLGALRVLSLWHDEQSFDLIRGRLSDTDAAIVSAALAALAPFGDIPTVREVERFVADPRIDVRLEAVAALERLPRADVRQRVYDALKDREAAVRIEAGSQLARYADEPETYIRLGALLLDDDIGVRDAAALALVDTRDARAFPVARKRLAQEKDALVRADLVDALATADKDAAVPALIGMIGAAKAREKTRIIVNLHEITGQSIPIDQAKWQSWYDASKKGESAPEP